MALKFGPQWLRDLSDGGTNTSQPSTPTASVKFKLADYRYGREEMLALFNEHSTPPDQVRKHLSIFSKEIQKPITMLPLTEDEQRLISQGFNSTVVLRAASRGSGPPIRSSRGGGTSDRGRGRGRGRGEGYISRTENGDVGYSRSTQDGWEQVGRKFERSYSRGYDDIGPKREYIRSSSDNWRDKKFEDDEEDEEGGTGWRNNRERWGSSTRANWREGQRDNYEIDRRPIHQRGFDQESRGVQRANENYDNEGDVPEWVADDVGDDPGTFDSSGAFVSTRQGKKYIEIRREPPPPEDSAKNNNPSHTPEERTKNSEVSKNSSEKSPPAPSNKSVYVPPNARNGNGDSNDSKEILGKQNDDKGETNSHSETQISFTAGHSNKGDGDSGFAIPNPELVKETRLPPGQNIPYTPVPPTQSQLGDTPVPQPPTNSTRLLEMDRLQLEKSLQNFVAEMTAGAERRSKGLMETSLPVNPPNSEDANKWFYKDPQGEVQGPFTNEEMAQWFSAGYFTMSLIVKRGCDDSYKPLGELIKRYGRVPFLPGPPLPPLITGNMPAEPTVSSTPPLAVPPLVPPMSAPLLGQPLVNVADPHIVQQMFLQQEFIKQTYLRKLQQLQQLQDPESFKNLAPEHIPMQLLMQANPLLMQHQLLLQQQQQEHSLATAAAFSGDDSPAVFPHSSSLNSSTANTIAPSNIENESAWPSSMSQIIPGIWPIQPTQIPAQQPASLWDTDGNNVIPPAYLAQIEKLRRDREEERLKEEEKAREEELQRKKEELLRQQEELERQREQMRREKEDLERQKQIEIQKIEEARRQEEEKIKLEIERQNREKEEEERRLHEMAKRQLEAERKREKELEKQEKKRRKEEEKRLEEERKRSALAAEKIVAQYEQIKESRKKAEEEAKRQQQELERLQKEERLQRETAEKERLLLEAQRKQNEALRQQELKKLQQQKDQLANIQLPASTKWAAVQQTSPMYPTQSKSLTEIQEEARQEEERLREHQIQMQRIQEQFSANQSQQQTQKSWATSSSQALPVKGLSLLHIQQQEAEKAKKSEKEKTNNNAYTAKVAQSIPPTWTGSTGTWTSSQPVWNTALSNTAGFWDSVTAPAVKKTTAKESGEFPALKTAPVQQLKKTNMKDVKATNVKAPAVAKFKKEEETVQKLFQHRQQDDFSQWVTERVVQFSVSIDVPTFVSFIVEVESPDEVQDYIKTYLGDNKESREFAKKFVDKRNKFRNQARLVRQQEEDSIWGPAPAINPHNLIRGSGNPNNINTEGREGTTSKAKNRKKKQKMQKLDGSKLGFTVQADSNRKNAAGEFEVIE